MEKSALLDGVLGFSSQTFWVGLTYARERRITL